MISVMEAVKPWLVDESDDEGVSAQEAGRGIGAEVGFRDAKSTRG